MELPTPGSDLSNIDMTGGRQSDFALIKRGTGYVRLQGGASTVEYRFSGGTTVEDGGIFVDSGASLRSNIVVQSNGWLSVSGGVAGNVTDDGTTSLSGTITGDVSSSGVLTPGSSIYGDAVPARIEGNFSQTSTGTLDAVIGATSGGYLSVTGRAYIDGTLRLVQYDDEWGPYPLPPAPLSLKVLHADGGVFGQFAQWTSPGLLITGSVRYLANDVFFDASSISAAQAMAAAHAGDAVTLSAARDFDAALDGSVGLARSPGSSLTDPQRRFLESAAMIQRLQNYEQAVRTFDSLSGYGYLAAADALLQQATMPAQGLIARVSNLQPGSTAGTWSAQPTTLATGAGAFSEQHSGFDQWLGDGLLMGGSVGWSDGNLKFDRSGGNARDRSPQWDFYVRRTGANDSYVLGNVGYSQHDLSFGRQIDLGLAKRNAYAIRDLDVEHAWVESGREFRILQSRVTPFAALSYAAMHGAGFTERGNTGFELAAQPSFHQRINAAAGLRFSRYWGSGKGRWTQLNLSGGFLHLLSARDDAYAAFTGAPDVTFALAGLPRQRNTGWLQMSLGTGGENWAWLLNYDRQAEAEAASVGMQVRF
ncbi:MAG TPA: autotransporter domain-containing protein [Rhodanobacteraceae bacterium]|nr:autotransporter domain-containing protein [Rhodanobacteraceae bacterium]